MKLIHHGGYNDQERDAYKEIIFSNTIQSMRYASSTPTLVVFLLLTVFSFLFLRLCHPLSTVAGSAILLP